MLFLQRWTWLVLCIGSWRYQLPCSASPTWRKGETCCQATVWGSLYSTTPDGRNFLGEYLVFGFQAPWSHKFTCMFTNLTWIIITGTIWFHCCCIGQICWHWRWRVPPPSGEAERAGFHLFLSGKPIINIIRNTHQVDKGFFNQRRGKIQNTTQHLLSSS